MSKPYLEIRKKLEERIREEEGEVQTLPTLRALAKEYGCTAPTMLRAIQSLVANGLLAPRSHGGYISVPESFFGRERKIAAVITGGGMHVYDSNYFCLMRFNAVFPFTCSDPLNVSGIANIYLNTYDDLKSILRNKFYSGLIFVSPKGEILKKMEKICRSAALPVGVFGADVPCGKISMSFDIRNDFYALFRELVKMGRRRILVYSGYNYFWNETMPETIREFSDSFETLELYQGAMEQAAEYGLQNIGKKGKKYDTVVFSALIPGAYAKQRAQAPECLFVTNNFATLYESDFHGLLMHFDLETAGKIFGKDMHDAVWENNSLSVHRTIPCDIRKIK